MKFVVAVGPKRRSPETATNNINASSRRLRRVRAFQGARGYDDDVHHLQQNKPIDEAAAPALECIASPHLLSNSAGWEKEQDEDAAHCGPPGTDFSEAGPCDGSPSDSPPGTSPAGVSS